MARLADPILNELREEIPATRRILDRVPADKLGWKPHDKSRTLGELALHVAALPGMAATIANQDEFSPNPPAPGAAPRTITSEEIRTKFEDSVAAAEKALDTLSDERAQANWRLVFRGQEILKKPRIAALRSNVLNHMYHHRGQLSVYLRLLNVPVPVVYGPTADENPFLKG